MITNPPYVIAEIGVNHNGSLNRAKKLIAGAQLAGASSVKFQTYFLDELLSSSATNSSYQIQNLTTPISQHKLLEKFIFSISQYEEIVKYCNDLEIEFLSTPFGLKSASLLKDLGLKKIKISSGDITNLELLEHVSENFDEIILSTGMSNFEEIDKAVEVIGKKCDFAILHCVSSYPAPIEECNIRSIAKMKERYNCNIGWSDHTLCNLSAILALSNGASIFEKHITLNVDDEGPDHKSSMNLEQFTAYINTLEDARKCLGYPVKNTQTSEKEAKIKARRSIAINRDLKKGDVIKQSDLIMLRPGNGISPLKQETVVGRELKTDIKQFDLILYPHLEDIKLEK